MTRISSLALFPLSDVVLLPEVSVPLYIFEPRYRQMTRAALEGTHQIGMVTVRPEGASAMAGDPPLFEVGCVGRLTHAQERPDGTFQILLVGEQRFRLVKEDERPASQLFRSAEIELLEDHAPKTESEEDAFAHAREELLSLVLQLVARVGSAEDPQRVRQALDGLEPAPLVNSLSQSISLRPIERQQLIETDSIIGRCETLSDLLRFRLAAGSLADLESGSLPH
jgi:Lon protease-like protein